ncbi:MAG: helix-turn-helix domain-containing protein [Pseudomonadales bacterium]
MEGQKQRSGLFAVLKRVLKAQGIHYRELAEMMNLSEPTVKRMFQEQDCKVSRLIEICDLVGLSINELVELDANRTTDPTQLSIEIEQALADDPGLTSFFMLLVSQFDVETIAQKNQLSSSDAYLYLRELEKLELIRLGKNDQVHLRVSRPIKWRLGGPLHQTLVKVNQRFIQQAISAKEGEGVFYSTSRLLSTQSITRLNQEVDELYQRFQKQATLDQLYYSLAELKPYKLVATMMPFEISRYFLVPAFAGRPKLKGDYSVAS